MEAWGRKKRSVSGDVSLGANGKPMGDDMTLSREIVVLDLKEKSIGEQTTTAADSQDVDHQSELTNGDSLAQKAPLRSATSKNQRGQSQQDSSSGSFDSAADSISMKPDSTNSKHCLSSQSVFVLICSIGLFFILNICVVAYFFARRYPIISPIKHQYH